MSAAGTKPGDLDFDLDLLWFIVLSQLLWRLSSVLMVGAHVTRASAPARRVPFASSKGTEKRLSSLRPPGSLTAFAYAEMSTKTRYRSNSLSTIISATLTTFGAAEREH
jgi:hypothetical protein